MSDKNPARNHIKRMINNTFTFDTGKLCQICGAVVTSYRKIDPSLIHCAYCRYWLHWQTLHEKVKAGEIERDQCLIINGRFYNVGDPRMIENYTFKTGIGHFADEFTIRILATGEEFITNNLWFADGTFIPSWYGGEPPEWIDTTPSAEVLSGGENLWR